MGPIGSRVMNVGHGASSCIRSEREGYKSHYLYDYCEYCGRKFIFTTLSILLKKLKTSPLTRFDDPSLSPSLGRGAILTIMSLGCPPLTLMYILVRETYDKVSA